MIRNKLIKWTEKQKLDQPEDRKRSLILLGVIVVLVLAARFVPLSPQPVYVALTIGEEDYFLEYAAGKQQQRQGLKHRPGVAPGSGIIMDLHQVRPVTVSLEGVNFPLTVFTLSEHLMILEVAHLAPSERHAFSQACRYLVQIPELPDLEAGGTVTPFSPPSDINLSLISLGPGEVL